VSPVYLAQGLPYPIPALRWAVQGTLGQGTVTGHTTSSPTRRLLYTWGGGDWRATAGTLSQGCVCCDGFPTGLDAHAGGHT
jgi:hypothetical protein